MRKVERGGAGYLNDPMTTITQTKAVDRIEPKKREGRREQGPYVLNSRGVGVGGGLAGERERERTVFSDGWGSPVLIAFCLLSFPANPLSRSLQSKAAGGLKIHLLS